MRGLWIGLFCLLVLPACAPTAPPPIEVTRVVTVEVAYEVPMPVEVTRLVMVTAPPRATATPLPTHAPVEGPLQPTCWGWREAAERVGASGCVEGTVTGTGESQSAFFINFSEEPRSFYLVAFDWRWAALEGRCVRVEGTISTFRDRPQMIINDPERLRACDGGEFEVVAR